MLPAKAVPVISHDEDDPNDQPTKVGPMSRAAIEQMMDEAEVDEWCDRIMPAKEPAKTPLPVPTKSGTRLATKVGRPPTDPAPTKPSPRASHDASHEAIRPPLESRPDEDLAALVSLVSSAPKADAPKAVKSDVVVATPPFGLATVRRKSDHRVAVEIAAGAVVFLGIALAATLWLFG